MGERVRMRRMREGEREGEERRGSVEEDERDN